MVIVTVQGLDETFSQTVQAQHYYRAQHIVWAHRFVDMVQVSGGRTVEVDHTLLDAIEPSLDPTFDGR
jgi:inward rectifier potassium channel